MWMHRRPQREDEGGATLWRAFSSEYYRFGDHKLRKINTKEQFHKPKV
jgi:hypothetical protein